MQSNYRLRRYFRSPNWANKIVASIEDENGEIIDSSNFESFEAETIISEIKINIIE